MIRSEFSAEQSDFPGSFPASPNARSRGSQSGRDWVYEGKASETLIFVAVMCKNFNAPFIAGISIHASGRDQQAHFHDASVHDCFARIDSGGLPHWCERARDNKSVPLLLSVEVRGRSTT